jgi:hypothetical protein
MKQDSWYEKAIKIAAIGAFGYSAYRTGLLKKPIEKSLEFANKNYKGNTTAIFKGTKKWLNHSFENIEKSALRSNNFKDVYNNLFGKTSYIGRLNTKTDINNLFDIIKREKRLIKDFEKYKKNIDYMDSEMITDSKSILNTFATIAKREGKDLSINENTREAVESIFIQSDVINEKLKQRQVEEVIKIFSLTDDIAAQMEKRTGYRKLRIKDVFHNIGDNGKLGTKKEFKYLLKQNNLNNINKESKEFIESFFLNQNTGKKRFKDIENMIFDKNLMINNKGNLIDLRQLNKDKNFLGYSLSTDFSIPFININPLRMFGIDKKFQNQRKFAILTGHQAGVDNKLVKKLGEESPKLFSNGHVFDIKTGEEINKGIEYTLYNTKSPIAQHSIRKIWGLELKDFKDFQKSDGMYKYSKSKIGRFLNLGFQDTAPKPLKAFDIMSWPNAILNKTGKILKPATASSPKSIENIFDSSKKHFQSPGSYIAIKKGINPLKNGDVLGFLNQFVAGRRNDLEMSIGKKLGIKSLQEDNIKNVTTHTLMMYKLTETLNGSLATLGLGLSTKSLGSVQSVYKELIMKRFLPVYIGAFAWNYINYEGEKIFGSQPEDTIAESVVKTDLQWHKLKDKLGITPKAKRLKTLTPGLEQISEIPGLGSLDMSSSYKERLHYWKEGEDAIRKGRYWALGNSPFTGGKIDYFRPNWYRRVKSDWQYTNSKYGSRKEYFSNSWLPTPRHPLAPVKHFVTDKYHWEEKHYYDRPYLVSGTMGENVPFFGPVIAATIGKILKPTKKMHLDYWGKQGQNLVQESYTGNYVPLNLTNNTTKGVIVPITPMGQAQQTQEQNKQQNNVVVNTMSGQSKIYQTTSPINIRDFNEKIKQMAALKANKNLKEARTLPQQGLDSVKLIQYLSNEKKGQGLISPTKTPYGIKNTIGQQYYRFTEQFGMWGFNMNAATGDLFLNSQTIQPSARMMDMKRNFWDLNLGGLGGELSEIGRRFIPKHRYNDKEYNPIRNNMPDWMPDKKYFTDFQSGDPYIKVPMGEMRLPGEGWESLNGKKNIMELGIGSSSLGKSKKNIIKHLLNKDEFFDEEAESIVNKGTLIHRLVQDQFGSKGYLIDAEQQIKDNKNHIVGYYDGRIYDRTSPKGQSILEIKSMSKKKYNKNKPFEEHITQLNWYLHETGLPKGYLYYLPRDNWKKAKPKIYEIYYDDDLYNRTINKLQSARKEIYTGLKNGSLNRGDLYDAFDRFKILADVAPYSEEYKEAKSLLSNVILSEEEKIEKKEIEEQVSEKKKSLRLYPYRFKTANIEKVDVTINRVDNFNRFYTKEYPNHPISFAGMHISIDKNNPIAKKAQNHLKNIIKPGSKITIGIDGDSFNVFKNNTYKSISAVVYKNKRNINKELLNKNLATEDEDDFSPAGVHSRFSAGEIRFGSAFESFAHMDTIAHTKLLQVRSPLESYKRRHLYGKNFQTWEEPIKDILLPAYEKTISRSSVFSILAGAFIGASFGRNRFPNEVSQGFKYGRLIGGTIGAGIAGIGEIKEFLYKTKNKETWIPERRRKERELNEYIDMLKFVKNKRLFELYAKEAKRKENFDIKQYLKSEDNRGNKRQEKVNKLQYLKRTLRQQGEDSFEYVLNNLKLKEPIKELSIENLIKEINRQIRFYQNYRDADKLPPNALAALYYHKQSEQTMYGYDTGEPLTNLLKALPKTERQYFSEFLKAPEEEKMEILSLAPSYLRRPLESAWGLPVEKKRNIVNYFKEHQLPGPNWIGWNQNVNLDDVKIKLIQKVDLDETDFNVWPEEVKQAATKSIPIPQMNKGDRRSKVENRLRQLLTKSGINDLQIEMTPSDEDETTINLKFDKKREIEQYINRHKNSIFDFIF